MRVRVFAGPKPTEYTLYEDDGQTRAHRDNHYRTTFVRHATVGKKVTVTISPANDHAGAFELAPASRRRVVEVVSPGGVGEGVSIDGVSLAPCGAGLDVDTSAVPCFVTPRPGLVQVASAALAVGKETTFEVAITASPSGSDLVSLACTDASTTAGETLYVSGSAPALGAWDPAKALPMSTFDALYPHWMLELRGLAPGVPFEWNCFKVKDDGKRDWQAGPNPKERIEKWGTGSAKGQATREALDFFVKAF